MRLTFLGVRGSFPVADRRMQRIGGNTASVMLEAGGRAAFLDAGTGIIRGGHRLMRRPPAGDIRIFLTHLHLDHIQGLPFFPPLYDSRFRVQIYCPLQDPSDLQRSILTLFQPPFSPVTRDGIRARIAFHALPASGRARPLPLGDGWSLDYRFHRCHPLLGSALYSLQRPGMRVVYATDIESPGGLEDGLADFISGAGILIHDAQYRDRDYRGGRSGRRGYGHSPVSAAVANARRCGVGRLYLFHYDPEYGDAAVAAMGRFARREFPGSRLAREMQQINIP